MSLLKDVRIFQRQEVQNPRGWLLKPFTGEEGRPVGEVYVVHSRPGEIRGQHFHRRAFELFTLLEGEASLELLDVASGERSRITLSEKERLTVEVPPGLAHAVVAEGERPMLLLAVATEAYDPEDTVPWPVLQPSPASKLNRGQGA